jgi:hypothetical protein
MLSATLAAKFSFNQSLCPVLQSPSQQEVLSALKRRLEQTAVPEFPRHRLRMLSKLAEGAFGTVSSTSCSREKLFGILY